MTDLPDLAELDFEPSLADELILGCMSRADELDLLLADDAPNLSDPAALRDFVFTASRYAMSVLPFFRVLQRPTGEPISAPPQLTDKEKCSILLALDKRVSASLTKMFTEANVPQNFAGVVQLRRLRDAALTPAITGLLHEETPPQGGSTK